jgi:hypothetical protein
MRSSIWLDALIISFIRRHVHAHDKCPTTPTTHRRQPSGGEAQHGCIEAVAASGLVDIRDGLALESAIFARLLQSEQSQARRYFFFSERATTHAHHLGDVPKPMPIRRVGVVGGGTMGSGILVAFLDAGVEAATMVEVNEAALEKSLGLVKAIYASRVRRGQMTAEQAAAIGACVGGLSWRGGRFGRHVWLLRDAWVLFIIYWLGSPPVDPPQNGRTQRRASGARWRWRT